jgi:hypothetical protein
MGRVRVDFTFTVPYGEDLDWVKVACGACLVR